MPAFVHKKHVAVPGKIKYPNEIQGQQNWNPSLQTCSSAAKQAQLISKVQVQQSFCPSRTPQQLS